MEINNMPEVLYSLQTENIVTVLQQHFSKPHYNKIHTKQSRHKKKNSQGLHQAPVHKKPMFASQAQTHLVLKKTSSVPRIHSLLCRHREGGPSNVLQRQQTALHGGMGTGLGFSDLDSGLGPGLQRFCVIGPLFLRPLWHHCFLKSRTLSASPQSNHQTLNITVLCPAFGKLLYRYSIKYKKYH